MFFSKYFLLQFAVCSCFTHFAYAFDYTEISRLNASCLPKDTCSLPRDLDDSDTHNCDCSSLCVLYDTCCIDSPFVNLSSKYERHASCKSAGQSQENVFMVDNCQSSFEGPAEISSRCEGSIEDWSDPISNVPVTNIITHKTYTSLFCAICNGEQAKELTMWQVVLDCSELKGSFRLCTEERNFVLNNMMYIRDKGQWGIWSYDKESDWKFRFLGVSYKIPDDIKNFVKECRPNLISSCPSTYHNRRVKRLCSSYMAVVYFLNGTYRNVHCALCNNITNMELMSCHENKNLAFKGPNMNFGMLLDIDLRHGDKVGNVEKKCLADQVYDPFTKKCRNIECPLPGYTLKNKKCVKQ